MPQLAPEHRDAIIAAVRSAARLDIMPRFRTLGAAEIAEKTSAVDLVTIADTDAEARITRALRAAWPAACVIGEEAVSQTPELMDQLQGAEWAIVIDPVDGTWNFAKGLATFGTIIAVTYQGRTVWGMLYDPVFDDWIEVALGQGTTFHQQGQSAPMPAQSGGASIGETTGYMPLFMFEDEVQTRLASCFPDFARIANLRCSCHEYRMLAQGHVDFVVAVRLNPWDHLAGALAVTELGGVARLFDGQDYGPLTPSAPMLIARSPQVWDAVAARLGPAITGG